MGFFTNRRNKIIDRYLKTMTSSGTTEYDCRELYFDAACRYAKDHGGKIYDDMADSITFNKNIEGADRVITFVKDRVSKGTYITIADEKSASDQVTEYFNQHTLEQAATPMRDAVERILSGHETLFRSDHISLNNIKSFYEIYCTIIPPRFEIEGYKAVYVGLASLPESGDFFVSTALVNDEAIVLASTAVEIPQSSAIRSELFELQNELFDMYRNLIDDEVK